MTFGNGIVKGLLILAATASLKTIPCDVDELLSLNHANMTRASPLQVTAEQFRPIGILGTGTFGFINLVQLQPKGITTPDVVLERKGDIYALKRVHRENYTPSPTDMEKLALESANHPFIIQLHASFEDKKYFHFLMEQGCSPDLCNLVRHRALFKKKSVQFYVASMMLALEHLHSRGIVHRDLKLQNIVLGTDGFPRLIDFGAAKLTSDNTIDIAGTPRYFSPEVISNRPHGPGVDWWALGHAMYEMLVGKPVFPRGADVRTAVIEFPADIDKDAADLIRRLLEKEPSKRLGVVDDSWKIITEHPWFAGFDWIKLLKREVKAPIDVEFLSNGACKAVIPT